MRTFAHHGVETRLCDRREDFARWCQRQQSRAESAGARVLARYQRRMREHAKAQDQANTERVSLEQRGSRQGWCGDTAHPRMDL